MANSIRNQHRLHWNIDSLVVRDGTFFGIGWVFDEDVDVHGVELKVKYVDDESRLISAGYGKPRADVADTFSRFQRAAHSGLFLLGSSDKMQAKFSELALLVKLEDGSQVELSIPPNRIRSFEGVRAANGGVTTSQLVASVKRSIHLIRRFEVASLLTKARKFFSNRRAQFLTDAGYVRSLLLEDELRNVVLVIDHDQGGGANLYREAMVTEKLAGGATVLILSFSLVLLTFILMVRTQCKNERFAIPGYDFLLELVDGLELVDIVYNTGVSFMYPERLPPLIATLKRKYNPRLSLLVHDFFMVCPSHYLLDDAGRYCGIPDMERCRACLRSNRQDFSLLFRAHDMVQWRKSWGEVIALADEVRTFSGSSRSLMQKAYPELEWSRISVIPHEVMHLKDRKIEPTEFSSLRIGVVGQIGYHKGAMIVRDLAREIKARGVAVRIIVIGTIEASCEPAIVSETGPYSHNKLVNLIERSGANIMLFPSIWPETFSYVVQELMELDLPVACYDVGAPAERLRVYGKGMILKNTNPSAMLDDLIAFHQRLYLTERA